MQSHRAAPQQRPSHGASRWKNGGHRWAPGSPCRRRSPVRCWSTAVKRRSVTLQPPNPRLIAPQRLPDRRWHRVQSAAFGRAPGGRSSPVREGGGVWGKGSRGRSVQKGLGYTTQMMAHHLRCEVAPWDDDGEGRLHWWTEGGCRALLCRFLAVFLSLAYNFA